VMVQTSRAPVCSERTEGAGGADEKGAPS